MAFRPPPLEHAPLYPFSSLVAVCAIIVSGWYWSGHDISNFALTGDNLRTHPWTLLSTILPHGGVIHIVFNLLWWWQLATAIEAAWGWARLLGITALLAIVSSAAEYAFLYGGIGLSGVVYGLYFLLYALPRSDSRFEGHVTKNNTITMVFWFLLCVAMTAAGEWHIANIAHGVGALTGWLLGLAIAAPARRRVVWVAALGILTAMSLAGATIARPFVNYVYIAHANQLRGYEALVAGRYQDAVKLFERAAKKHPEDAANWVYLGIAYEQLGRVDDALECFKRAVSIDPSRRDDVAPSVFAMMNEKYNAAMAIGDADAAAVLQAELGRWSQ